MSLARCGDHNALAYSKIGRTRDLYKIEKNVVIFTPYCAFKEAKNLVCFMNCLIDMFCPGQVIRHDNYKIFITGYIC